MADQERCWVVLDSRLLHLILWDTPVCRQGGSGSHEGRLVGLRMTRKNGPVEYQLAGRKPAWSNAQLEIDCSNSSNRFSLLRVLPQTEWWTGAAGQPPGTRWLVETLGVPWSDLTREQAGLNLAEFLVARQVAYRL